MHYLPEQWQKGNTRRTKKFHSHLLVNNEEQEKVKTTAVNCNGWFLMKKHLFRFILSKMRKYVQLPLTFSRAYVDL